MSGCKIIRRKLVTSKKYIPAINAMRTISARWVTKPCGTPVFRTGQVCDSCLNGWHHPQNFMILSEENLDALVQELLKL